MEKKKAIILGLVLSFVFILIYTPHIVNPYPIHIDEWHHISQAIKLNQGDFTYGLSGLEIGFRIFLIFLMSLTDIVLFYKFFPAIWAVFSALALFYVIRKKTQDIQESFFIAILAIIFFASIKSNINILGLWFFTPLTFSIPFIFLYIYLFTEGLEKENKKMLFSSLLIMSMLIFIHSISLLFSIPFLLIYCLINFKKTKKQFKILVFFLIIPILGILFYKFLMQISFKSVIMHLFNSLQFKKGWGVVELNNSLFEIYSLIGYLLAIIGILTIIFNREYIKKYLIYILWPITLLISIFIFKTTGVSYLSPYQRNLYYFAISLPFLSAFGFYFIFCLIKNATNKMNLIINKKILNYLILILLIFLVIISSFASYFDLSRNIKPYKVIDKEDYKTLKFLSKNENGIVLAPILISDAVFPVSKFETVATIYFSGNRTEVEKFYSNIDCNKKNDILKRNNARYVLAKNPINCNWTTIYNNNDFIYKVS